MLSLIVLGLAAAFVAGSDLPCTMQNGVCQDYRYTVCTAGYKTGLCGGPAERQCCASSSGGRLARNNCGGNIAAVETSGASKATASQDNLLVGGVSSSRKMAQNDFNRMSEYRSLIKQAARQLNCVDASVIAGIISRETRAGAAIGNDGYGADGHGYGLMQVDDRYHSIKGGPFSLEHILQGTEILMGMINGVASKHPSWDDEMVLKGGISAYNAGIGNVQSYENMDVGTTGNDYGNDVSARSQYYNDNGY